MKLKNILIAVKDIDSAIKFYNELFGLQVILAQEGNVIMSDGLVLQDAGIWKNALDKELLPKSNTTALYFEETDLDSFLEKLKKTEFNIEYVNEPMMHTNGRKTVRFYDPDGNLIEVSTS